VRTSRFLGAVVAGVLVSSCTNIIRKTPSKSYSVDLVGQTSGTLVNETTTTRSLTLINLRIVGDDNVELAKISTLSIAVFPDRVTVLLQRKFLNWCAVARDPTTQQTVGQQLIVRLLTPNGAEVQKLFLGPLFSEGEPDELSSQASADPTLFDASRAASVSITGWPWTSCDRR
jgi:hypothetical protein